MEMLLVFARIHGFGTHEKVDSELKKDNVTAVCQPKLSYHLQACLSNILDRAL
jgi:hypothetical protein